MITTFTPNKAMDTSSALPIYDESSVFVIMLVSLGLIIIIDHYKSYSTKKIYKKQQATRILRSAIAHSIDEQTSSNQVRIDTQKIIRAIKNGALLEPGSEYDHSALDFAATHNNIELAKLLINMNADITRPNWLQDDPMTQCIISNRSKTNINLLKLFLDQGYPINQRDARGNTQVHHAANRNNCEVLAFLLDNNACIDLQNQYGNSPLHSSSGAESAQLLLDRGADFSLKDTQGKTAAELALYYWNPKKAAIILSRKKELLDRHNALKITIIDATDYFKEYGLAEIITAYAEPDEEALFQEGYL